MITIIYLLMKSHNIKNQPNLAHRHILGHQVFIHIRYYDIIMLPSNRQNDLLVAFKDLVRFRKV